VPAVLEAFGVEKDARGKPRRTTDGKSSYLTSVPKIFVAGHAPRAVARRVGDPRRPPVRSRGRRVSDGFFRVAAVGGIRPNSPAFREHRHSRRGSGQAHAIGHAQGAASPGGRALLAHVFDTAKQLSPKVICVVYGHGGELVRQAVEENGVVWVMQSLSLAPVTR